MWTYRILVCGPVGNWFVDLLATVLWTYWTPVCGPNGNQFVDLSETSLCPAPNGFVSFSETLNLTKTFDGADVPKLVRGPMR